MFSKNVSTRQHENITSISSIRFANELGKYLGFPLVKDRVSRATFTNIIGKIKSCSEGWKGKLLNRSSQFNWLSLF